VKVQIAEKHPSGAKDRRVLSAICGTLRLRSGQALKPCPFKTRLSPQTAIPRDFVGVYPCKG
jgi:hypothetical protein